MRGLIKKANEVDADKAHMLALQRASGEPIREPSFGRDVVGTAGGAAMGGIPGALLGHAVGGQTGSKIGGGLGALLGAAGSRMGARKEEEMRALDDKTSDEELLDSVQNTHGKVGLEEIQELTHDSNHPIREKIQERTQ